MKVSKFKQLTLCCKSIASSSSKPPKHHQLSDPDLMAASPIPNPVTKFNVDSPVTPPSSSAVRKYSDVPARSPDRVELLWLLVQSPDQKQIPLTEEQIRYCREALTRLTKKLNATGRRRSIDKEFESLLPDRTQASKNLARITIGRLHANQPKNRYMDILPYDDTRVILEAQADNSAGAVSPYINASYLVDPVHENLPKFIATQGPLQNTIVDFWDMVLQQQCPVVVMLTALVDHRNEMVKCESYFPTQANECQIYGRIKVTNKCSRIYGGAVALRLLEVENLQAEDCFPVPVLHIQYLGWPDYGVPGVTVSVREIFKTLYRIPSKFGPFVAHCSAGIGRTGAFCTIDHTIRRILMGDMSSLDIENTVRNFRQQRLRMVQTMEQYTFCYKTVIGELEDLIAKRRV